jgi:hypothetical protein
LCKYSFFCRTTYIVSVVIISKYPIFIYLHNINQKFIDRFEKIGERYSTIFPIYSILIDNKIYLTKMIKMYFAGNLHLVVPSAAKRSYPIRMLKSRCVLSRWTKVSMSSATVARFVVFTLSPGCTLITFTQIVVVMSGYEFEQWWGNSITTKQNDVVIKGNVYFCDKLSPSRIEKVGGKYNRKIVIYSPTHNHDYSILEVVGIIRTTVTHCTDKILSG